MQLFDVLKQFFIKNAGVNKIAGVFGRFKVMIADLEDGIKLCGEQRDKNAKEVTKLAAEIAELQAKSTKAFNLKKQIESFINS